MKAFNWIGLSVLGLTAISLFSQSPESTPATQQPPQAVAQAVVQTSQGTPTPVQPLTTAQVDRLAGQVVSTGDGDTLAASINGQQLTIRLACIDAPETSQPYGREAADYLRALLPRGAAIQVRVVDTDRYGRTVAEIYRSNGNLVNVDMVQSGHAVVYYDYLAGCEASRDRLIAAETTAKDRRLAFWSQSNPIMPWDWRQGARPSTAPAPAPAAPRPVATPAAPVAPAAPVTRTSSCDPSYPDFCIPPNSPDLDCGNISQRRFRVRQPDPHRFDGDRDGIGCES
jgi:micrococcal nuclease